MSEIKKIFPVVVFLLWCILVVITGLHHECWADEAQSWLIARDCPLFDIIFKLSKYEGTPSLWFIILKFFCLIHFPYKFIFVIPAVATATGVYLLLFKSKLNPFIKYLSPFTFFIAFQYAIIARNYCLIFPLMALIAVFYDKRHEKSPIYVLFLILLSQVSFYGFVLSFILFAFFSYETIKDKFINKKTATMVVAYIFIFALTVILTMKPSDCAFEASVNFPSLKRLLVVLLSGYFNVVKNKFFILLQAIIVLSMYVSMFFAYPKTKCQLAFALGLNCGLVFVMASLWTNNWHFGYIIITLIFTLWVLGEENSNSSKKKIFKNIFIILFVLLSLLQIKWTFKCARYDIRHEYSGSYNAYKFIKEKNLDKYKISAIGYRTVSLLPYFEKNIYKNFDNTYWEWRKSSEYDKYMKAISHIAPVIIYDPLGKYDEYRDFVRNLMENDYMYYDFFGNLYAKGEFKEPTDIIIFIRKDILPQNQHDNR